MSARAYQLLWHVVAGAVEDAFTMHPDYFTQKGLISGRVSIIKRVTGTVLGFASQAGGRSGSTPAADTGAPVVTASRSGGSISVTGKTSGDQPKENDGAPEDGRRGDQHMLNVLERAPELNLEPTYTDRELKSARDFLTRKIARAEASGQPFAEIVVIGPELAHLLLQRNPADENRKLSQDAVAKYAADMANGRWQGLNGQTIVLSKDGYLNDGQHRLNAVIRCGGNIPFTVVFGAERESRMTLDQNKVRTSGDYIGMAGLKNGNKVAAVASILYGYENGTLRTGRASHQVMHSDDRPTKAALHAYALKHVDTIGAAIKVTDKAAARRLTTDTRLAAALCIIGRVAGHSSATEFIERVIEGDSLGKTNPAFQVRERLISEKLSGPTSVRRTLEIIFRGWNAHRRGDRLGKMVLRGELPEIEA